MQHKLLTPKTSCFTNKQQSTNTALPMNLFKYYGANRSFLRSLFIPQTPNVSLMTNKLLSLAVIAFAAFSVQPAACAAIVSGVTIKSVSSETVNSAADQRVSTNLVNGSGLFGNNHTWNITGS